MKRPRMVYWNNAHDWKLILPIQSGLIDIWRKGDEVFMRDDTGIGMGASEVLKLTGSRGINFKQNHIHNLYVNAKNEYPKFNSSLIRRLRVNNILIFIFVIQEIFFLAYRKLKFPYYTSMRALNMFCWAGGGIWLVMVLFRT